MRYILKLTTSLAFAVGVSKAIGGQDQKGDVMFLNPSVY